MTSLKFPRRKFLHLAAGAVALVGAAVFAISQGALAQGPAGRTLRLLVPFAAGGGADLLARLLSQQVGQSHNQTVVVENRPGAATVLGTEAVARTEPDGTTMLLVANSFLINSILRPNLRYNPLTSFEPICLLVSSPNLFIVNSSSPFRSLADFVTAVRIRPGELSIASSGPVSAQQLAVEVFKRTTNFDFTFVPFPGGAPAVTAVLGGHVTVVLAGYGEVAEHLMSGKLRPLAVLGRERMAALPDVPTAGESGYPDFEVTVWNGVVAPAKTPKRTIEHLTALFTSALQASEVKSKLGALALHPDGTCGAGFGTYLKGQHEYYARVIREANIKAE
jgi:tripartite-type tricarboxylate transporter receptor subunit TctC